MIKKSTLSFLQDLSHNNNKPWFDEHRDEYQDARNNFLELVNQLLKDLAAHDSAIANSLLDPRKCIMRINRDIRFSKDKTPYKQNFFAFMSKDGKKSPFGGYYINLQPGNSFVGGGIYRPDNEVLGKIRQEIDYNLSEWQKIVKDDVLMEHFKKGVNPSGELKRAPKGYDEDNPAIDYLKYKGFYTQRFYNDEEILKDNITERIHKDYIAVKPLVNFINRSML